MVLQIQKQKKNQEIFRSNISETTRGKWEHKPEEQKSTINNLKTFYNAREKVIKLFDDYTTIFCKAKYEAKQRKGLKILTAKQMLQRLTIAIAQLKAGSRSGNLLNEIRQIIYYLHREK